MVIALSFNRTFMELKWRIESADGTTYFEFQSYLYGIEIWNCGFSITVVFLFQSYLYGIEITERIDVQPVSSVSIVPLWN